MEGEIPPMEVGGSWQGVNWVGGIPGGWGATWVNRAEGFPEGRGHPRGEGGGWDFPEGEGKHGLNEGTDSPDNGGGEHGVNIGKSPQGFWQQHFIPAQPTNLLGEESLSPGMERETEAGTWGAVQTWPAPWIHCRCWL